MNAVPSIYMAYLAIFFGFITLVWSADRFVAGAAAIAKNMGVAPIIIGLTIVSFGTSAPEVLVSINASINGSGDLAVGNAIGSNIANVALVLAVTALISKIPVTKNLLKEEVPALFFIALLSGVFLWDFKISPLEGWVLLGLSIPTILYLILCKKKELSIDGVPNQESSDNEEIPDLSQLAAIAWVIVGLITLIISSRILVWGGETTATHFGVSPLIIGLTVIAVGTSLPELAASVSSALKGHHDIALGNIIGSNIFNLTVVMSLPGVINPVEMGAEVFHRDYLFMMSSSILLIITIAFALWKENRPRENTHRTIESHSTNEKFNSSAVSSATIGKFTGAILLLAYIGYYTMLFMSA